MPNAKNRWNQIYREAGAAGKPACVIQDHPELIPADVHALDIACGRGANALFLAKAGLHVDAWDISDVALTELQAQADAQQLKITTSAVEITARTLEGRSFDMIVNCHYLDRSLTLAIRNALVPGGLVFFQTFTAAKVANIGPRNPDFLLGPDELLAMFGGYDILAYRDESQMTDSENPMAGRAYLIARKPS